MRRLLPTLAALAALLLVLAPGASAQRHGGHAREALRAGFQRKAEHLGLSEAQREHIRSALHQHHDALQSLRDRVHDAHEALRQVLDDVPQDSSAVRAASSALESARTELAVARGLRQADVRAVLTPDQAQQAQAQRDQRREHKAERKALHREQRAERKAQRAADAGPR
jgi:Spy/CpxP family protein refolding chaperone